MTEENEKQTSTETFIDGLSGDIRIGWDFESGKIKRYRTYITLESQDHKFNSTSFSRGETLTESIDDAVKAMIKGLASHSSGDLQESLKKLINDPLEKK